MATNDRIYLSPPHMGGAELDFVHQAFESNFIAPLGPQLAEFEAECSRLTGHAHCVAVSSGTAAIHLGLRLLGVGPGDVVVASTLTFIGSISPATFLGADLHFVDCDAATWTMDPALLAEAVAAIRAQGHRVAAVVPTDLYGQCADYDALLAVCDPLDVPLFVDAAESVGATYKGRHAGCRGVASAYSFNGNKIITTGGGGLLSSDDKAFIDEARRLSQQARDPAPHYEHTTIGYNYRMSNVAAAIGLGQLGMLETFVARRRGIFDWYREALSHLPGVSFMPEAAYGRGNRWLTVMLLDEARFGAAPEDVRLALEAENIESRPVWKPMHLQPVFRDVDCTGGGVSEDLFRRGLCLPSGTALTEADLTRVAHVISGMAGGEPETMRLNLPNFRNLNFYAMLLADMGIFALALYLAYLFRFDFEVPQPFSAQFLGLLKYVLVFKGALFLFFGLYRGMWRYTSLDDYWKLLRVTALQSLILVSFVGFRFSFIGVPRSIFVIDWVLTLLLCSGLRLLIRAFYTRTLVLTGPAPGRRNVLMVGAGASAEKISRELTANPAHYNLVGFLDDDPGLKGRTIHGRPVLGAVKAMATVAERLGVDEIFIAVSEASGEEMRRMVDTCKGTGLPYKILPAMTEIIDGKVDIKALRDIDYLDLLGRSPVSLDTERIEHYLTGQTVLVTGCGGSIGSELCRQIVRFRPRHLVLVDSSEYNLYEIEMELRHSLGFADCTTVLGSVADRPLMDRTFQTHRPSTVFHAAAYKHVPMLERNPWQAVRNNIEGSRAVMRAAVAAGVERFVVVSTDKAVRPTNVMGASKRVTELLMQSMTGQGTRFMAVRFGNVVGSSGSVVPLFRRQIAAGGPVTVTHPDVTRYFMSISEATQLILQAGSMGEAGTGGEVFVLDMGVPVRIADMARDLIRLSGKEPGTDVEIVFTGLREGEKLFEELITEGEGIVRTEHRKILVVGSNTPVRAEDLDREIAALSRAADAHDGQAIRACLKRLVPEYAPDGN